MQARGRCLDPGPWVTGKSSLVPGDGSDLPVRVFGVLDRGFGPDLPRSRAGTRVPGAGAGPSFGGLVSMFTVSTAPPCGQHCESAPFFGALLGGPGTWGSHAARLARRGRADEVRSGLWAGGAGWSTARFRSGAGCSSRRPGFPLGVNSPIVYREIHPSIMGSEKNELGWRSGTFRFCVFSILRLFRTVV